MRIRTLLMLVGILAIVGVIAASVYFFGGYYSIAASTEDPAIVKWLLYQVRMASVRRHAAEKPPVSLDDPNLVKAGARAFVVRGCTRCHGGPGVQWEKFSEGLRPDPPDLKEIVNQREPEYLFWVVKNGINMTGMPSFGAIEVPDDEIWSITAFLKKLPSVSDADFRSWSAPPVFTPVPNPR